MSCSFLDTPTHNQIAKLVDFMFFMNTPILSGVVSLLSCKVCGMQYVGSTFTPFRTRFNNYKLCSRRFDKTYRSSEVQYNFYFGLYMFSISCQFLCMSTCQGACTYCARHMSGNLLISIVYRCYLLPPSRTDVAIHLLLGTPPLFSTIVFSLFGPLPLLMHFHFDRV